MLVFMALGEETILPKPRVRGNRMSAHGVWPLVVGRGIPPAGFDYNTGR